MSLPELLKELAELLPERVAVTTYTVVALQGEWVCIEQGGQTSKHAALIVEAAFREEIEARGWLWGIENGHFSRNCQAVLRARGPVGKRELAVEYAPTPAEALAAALNQALKGQP